MLLRRLLILFAAPLLIAASQEAQAPASDRFVAGFRNPPNEARPWVYWQWMDGNITRDGIERDLAWMHRVGLGGFHIFNLSLLTPQVVGHRLPYLSPEWLGALRFTMTEADRLGLRSSMHTAPGWSETGGPWVAPAQAMKKFVWTETQVTGGRRLRGRLPQPPGAAGPFEGIPRSFSPVGPPVHPVAPYYRDSAVFAWPLPVAARMSLAGTARVESSASPVEAAKLAALPLDEKPVLALAPPSGWVRFAFDRPRTVRALTVAVASDGFYARPVRVTVEASEDGVTWRQVAQFTPNEAPQVTQSIQAVTARFFRFRFDRETFAAFDYLQALADARHTTLPRVDWIPQSTGTPPGPIRIQRIALLSDARVQHFEAKAGFVTAPDYYALATPKEVKGSTVASRAVVDLTGRMAADGTLDWTPPPGEWMVVRMGYSPTGRENLPAGREATGLEVDKLSARHVRDYLNRFLALHGPGLARSGAAGAGLDGIITDSYEAGTLNWTDDMLAEFQRLRGYDPRPYLPALLGRIVDDAVTSDRFLYDFRRTIAELFAANLYGTVAKVARENGLAYASEALEGGRPMLGDDLEMRSHADVPMGAMWAQADGSISWSHRIDLRGAASVAHVMGRSIVGAEALTSEMQPWQGAPRNLKRTIDAIFAHGVNRIVLHGTVHQPIADAAPGLSLAIYGQYFNRLDTWGEQARPWIDYISRSSYLLQRGTRHADVAFFAGEEAPLTALYGSGDNAQAAKRYDYDYVSAETLPHRLRVVDGMIVSEGGARYRVLQLGGSANRMTLPVLRRLAELVDQGAVIVGEKPTDSPSLADDPKAFAALADALWRRAPGAGRGGVIARKPIEAALESLGLAPDWDVVGNERPELLFVHRTLPEGELYFVSNRARRAVRPEISFRVSDRMPERWDAETGKVSPLPYRIEGGRVIVPLALESDDAALILFRAPATRARLDLPTPVETPLADLSQGWEISFQPGRGAPAGFRPITPGSWSDSAEPGIRYFSGTATYLRMIDIPAAWRKRGGALLLDLGEVREIAEVSVNGRALGTLWRPPYRLDIAPALRPGRNMIEVRVTNLWVNRLIGDAQPGATHVAINAGGITYLPSAPLLLSGLIGPVRIVARR